LRDATYVAESLGMELETEGVGQIYKQSIPAGRVIKEKRLKVYLK